MLFKGERESRPCGPRRTAHVGRDAASAASQSGSRRASHVAVCGDGCLHPRSDVARPLDALKVHQVFLRGRKNVVVQREKRGR